MTRLALTSPSLPVILAAVRDAEWQSHVAAELRSWSTLVFVENVHQLPTAASESPPDVVLWHLDHLDARAESYSTAFQRLRRVAPASAVIAYSEMGRAAASQLVLAGRVGIDRLLLRGFDDLERGIRDTLRLTQLENVIRNTVAQMDIEPGPALFALLECLRRTSKGPTTVEELAHELKVSRRTLNRRLLAVGLPSPEHLISSCRVYWAAMLLGTEERSVGQVAEILGFSSRSDLCRMVARYAGCAPTHLRTHHGDAAIVILRACLDRSRRNARITPERVPSIH